MKETFLPHFQAMLPLILELLAPNQQAVDRQAALCIFDDLVEFTGQSSIPYLQHFLQAAVQYVADPDPAVRQAAVYGMGVYAQVGGAHIAPAIPGALLYKLCVCVCVLGMFAHHVFIFFFHRDFVSSFPSDFSPRVSQRRKCEPH